jgi:hypothetical protein
MQAAYHIRLAVVTSQALSTLIASFAARVEATMSQEEDVHSLKSEARRDEAMQQYADIGFLHCWEGLLSTQGKVS